MFGSQLKNALSLVEFLLYSELYFSTFDVLDSLSLNPEILLQFHKATEIKTTKD